MKCNIWMNSYAFIVIPLAGTCYYMIYKGFFFERTSIKEFTLMIFRVQLNCWRVYDFSENFQFIHYFILSSIWCSPVISSYCFEMTNLQSRVFCRQILWFIATTKIIHISVINCDFFNDSWWKHKLEKLPLGNES